MNGGSYSYYVRCQDGTGNANVDDFVITFSVAQATAAGNPVTSNFSGTENPLSENGMWDKPGAWTSLKKNNGAYSTDLLSSARLVTPVVGADQYAEITYDQDPGASSWVGVTTRVQGPGNGSGYLAIAYAGEVRLYRTDDNGSLNFTLLASATASVGTAPRRSADGIARSEPPGVFQRSPGNQLHGERDRVHDGAAGHCGIGVWRADG